MDCISIGYGLGFYSVLMRQSPDIENEWPVPFKRVGCAAIRGELWRVECAVDGILNLIGQYLVIVSQ